MFICMSLGMLWRRLRKEGCDRKAELSDREVRKVRSLVGGKLLDGVTRASSQLKEAEIQ